MRRSSFLALVVGLGACTSDPAAPANPNAGLLRDFLSDGKLDDVGVPLNGHFTNATAVCGARGGSVDDVFTLETGDGAGEACRGPLDGGGQSGQLVLNARFRVEPDDHRGAVATVRVLGGATELARATLSARSVRVAGEWLNFPVRFYHDGTGPLDVVVDYAGNGRLEIDYFELFPRQFHLAIDPGSHELDADEVLTFESARDGNRLRLWANSVEITGRLQSLLDAGVATSETSDFRRLLYVPTQDLLDGTNGTVELLARQGSDAARIQLRRGPPDCKFEGDPAGVKVLLTGFQPFPADARHENISSVAMAALDPAALPGAQVMRLVLPVEFDGAAAEVLSAIERCQPQVVISFGQGGDTLALEQTAYNLQDTSEVPGGVPDNRGIIAVSVPVAEAGEATRATRLPLGAVAGALTAIGEPFAYSDDPGRYICNNVFYAEAGSGLTAGFVHFPYRDSFTAADRQHWGRIAEVIVSAVISHS